MVNKVQPIDTELLGIEEYRRGYICSSPREENRIDVLSGPWHDEGDVNGRTYKEVGGALGFRDRMNEKWLEWKDI